jgi:hypothetical protein
MLLRSAVLCALSLTHDMARPSRPPVRWQVGRVCVALRCPACMQMVPSAATDCSHPGPGVSLLSRQQALLPARLPVPECLAAPHAQCSTAAGSRGGHMRRILCSGPACLRARTCLFKTFPPVLLLSCDIDLSAAASIWAASAFVGYPGMP